MLLFPKLIGIEMSRNLCCVFLCVSVVSFPVFVSGAASTHVNLILDVFHAYAARYVKELDYVTRTNLGDSGGGEEAGNWTFPDHHLVLSAEGDPLFIRFQQGS